MTTKAPAAEGVKLNEAWLIWLRVTWPTATGAPARATLKSTVPVGELGRPSCGEVTCAVKVNAWPAFRLVAEVERERLVAA